MTTLISTPKDKTSQGSITFDFDPHGNAHSYVIGGDVIVSGYYYAEVGEETEFTATVALPYGRLAIEYAWDFGDGVKGYGNPVVHTFKTLTSHSRVSLTVTDDLGHRYRVAKQMYFEDEEIVAPPEEGSTYGSDTYGTGTYGA
jgi:PKD repeat protein